VGGLTSLAVRSLAARPGRTILSIVGIALGVGVLFASLATDAGIEASIDRTVGDLVGRADLRVEAFGTGGLAPATLAEIEGAPGVQVAAPALIRRTYLGPTPGSAESVPPPVTILGIDPAREAAVRDLTLSAGRPLAGGESLEALLTDRLAASTGIGVGGTITIQAGTSGLVDVPVVGILRGDGPAVGSAGRTVVMPLRTMQTTFEDATVSRVDVVAGQGATPTEVGDALGVALTGQPYVLSSPAELATSLRASTADFRSTTALIAAVALFVGAFLIFNTLSMTVAERVRELGLLRAAGATRRQLVRFVVVQALVIGDAGALLGLVAGLAFAELMAVEVRSIGSVPFERVDPSLGSILLVLAVGLGVTIAASIEPARRAASISPVEALRERLDPVAARRARLRWLLVVFVVVGVAGLLVWPRDAGGAGLLRSSAVFAILLGAVLVSPAVLGGLAQLAGLPFRTALRLEERLARASLIRDRSRTALTVGALTIGLAMVVAIGGVAHQSRAAASAWLAEVLPGDELLTSIRPVALDEEVFATLQSLDGVERVSPMAFFEVARTGIRTDAAAVRGQDLRDDGRLRFVAGDRSTALAALDAGGTAILPRSLAQRAGLQVGSTVTLTTAGNEVLDLKVAGIVERSLPGARGEAMLIGWDQATATLGVEGADVFAIRHEADASTSERQQIDQTARNNALEPNRIEVVAGAVDTALGRIFGLFDALALVAVIVAALGIVNTLTVSVLERVRELGVLRAAGMTTRQVRRTVVVEAGILGLVGAVLGIVTGLIAAAVLVVLGGGPIVADLPWTSIAVAAILGVAVSMAAAWYPARLASRLAIVAAVQHE
jgi:putative ABC transport system permease protein